MNKKDIIDGLKQIDEYLYNLTKVDKDTEGEEHIKYFYKVIDNAIEEIGGKTK